MESLAVILLKRDNMAKLSKKTYLNKTFKFEYAVGYTPHTTDSKRFTKQDYQNKFEKTLLRLLKNHDKNAKIIINKVINDNSKDRDNGKHHGTVHYHIIIPTNKRLNNKKIDPNGRFNLKYFTFHIQDMYYAKGWQENYIIYKHHMLQVTHNFEKIQYIEINSKSLKSIVESEIIQYLMRLSLKYYQYTDKKAQISMFRSFGVQKYAVF